MPHRWPICALLLLVTCLSACQHETSPPIEEGLRPLNGTTLYVKKMGAGEPVIVVHGGPVMEHGYLLPHLEPMAEHYQLVFYDQRLSGRSAAKVDSGRVRMADFVADLDALRHAENMESFHLMGHSWGGLIAMQYALVHPQRLRSLILLNSMPGSATLWQEEEAVLAQRVSSADSLARQNILQSEPFANQEASAYQALYRVSFRAQFYDPAQVDRLHFYIPPDLQQRSQQFGAIMPDLSHYDLHARLTELTMPVLLLYGSDEAAVHLSGPALQTHLPHARMVVIPEAGHFPFVENPPAFFNSLYAFLEQTTD